MSKNRLVSISSHLHLDDNNKLEAGDKDVKVSLLCIALNETLVKFGVFYSKLRVEDESLVPKFARHS